MNPGSPTPQAGILNHSRGVLAAIQDKTPLLDDDPQHTKTENLIINTIIHAKAEGKADNTIHSFDKNLRQLSKHVNLTDPKAVKEYISNEVNEETGEPLAPSTKNKHCLAYEWLCKSNNLESLKTWIKPFYKVEEGTPLIPTSQDVNKIIGACSRKYATIFTIMAEIAVEGEELHKVKREKIDTEQGIISITGTKGHASANYKLKPRTAEMLRQYIAKNNKENPFPRAKIMGQIWQRTRNNVTVRLNQPNLKNIPLKNLRNYAGAQFYLDMNRGRRDPIATMRFMRHKKLETTMHYLRAINLEQPQEYTTKTVQLGQPDTQKQIIELLNAGYTKETEADGYQYFRKLGKEES